MEDYCALEECNDEMTPRVDIKNFEPVSETTHAIGPDERERDGKGDAGNESCGSNDSYDPSRGSWGGWLEFILSVMGYSIGLGNVWRFPYLCYENGGGAFIIPYLLMITFVALPIIFLEMSLGQFSSLGCISVWRFSRLFKGVGFAMTYVSASFCLYYNIVLAYCIYYLVVSFYNPQPWVGCDHEWNTENCFERSSRKEGSVANMSTTEVPFLPYATARTMYDDNFTTPGNVTRTRVRATEEFWKLKVLGLSDGLHDLGSIRWQLLLSFLAAWVLIYVCISKGIKSSGKAVFFTATFPYVLLFILLVRGATLEGSMQGVLFFIKPDFKKLGEAKVWQAAANQVFLSYSPGWGGMHTLASYNKFNNYCYRDAFMFCISCACTSIFSGFVIFSIIGFMAYDSNTKVEDVVDAGYGLAFVAFPEAVTRMWAPQLWSVLFFFMLIILGMDSQFVCLETLITAITDELAEVWPNTRRWKGWITFGTCLTMFLIGLPLVTQGGSYVMELLDWYVAGFSPMATVMFEVLVVSYIYGVKRIAGDIRAMLNFTPSLFWQLCWMFFSPALLTFIIVFAFANYEPPKTNKYTFPPWADALGWCLASVVLVFIFVYAVYYLCKARGTFVERVKLAVKPSPDWGPHLNKNRVKAGYAPLPGRGPYPEILVDQEDAVHWPVTDLTKSKSGCDDCEQTDNMDSNPGQQDSIV
ncbi:sodium- and chloride-dependent glycine transporter 1-like [Acanthaster planci]|uniref:Transporter n=1 Tax=Acanthaster planci TaxID=133434 RepID=A0A8B8A0L2_ACAPL|nr:sodium- and chloride-dependent glycine transporter 1-like [Acanthaster planci]